MLKETVSQNEATPEIMGVAFSLCLDVIWGEDPLGRGLWGLWCVFTRTGELVVASAVVGFSQYARFWDLFLESELPLAGVEYFWGVLKLLLGLGLVKQNPCVRSLLRRSSLVPRPFACLRIWTQFPLCVCRHIFLYGLLRAIEGESMSPQPLVHHQPSEPPPWKMDHSTKCKEKNFILVNRMWSVQIWEFYSRNGRVHISPNRNDQLNHCANTQGGALGQVRGRDTVPVHGTKDCVMSVHPEAGGQRRPAWGRQIRVGKGGFFPH